MNFLLSFHLFLCLNIEKLCIQSDWRGKGVVCVRECERVHLYQKWMKFQLSTLVDIGLCLFEDVSAVYFSLYVFWLRNLLLTGWLPC